MGGDEGLVSEKIVRTWGERRGGGVVFLPELTWRGIRAGEDKT